MFPLNYRHAFRSKNQTERNNNNTDNKYRIMKKKILGLALIAMSFVTFTSMAQSNSSDSSTTRQEKVKTIKENRKGNRPEKNPFEGMNLTETQKSQLKQLDEKRKAERQQKAEARKAEKTAKADKSAKTDKNNQADKAAKMAERRAAKKAYLDEVKAIIGPEQYVVFLENMYTDNGGHRHGNKADIGQGKGSKGKAARRGGHGNRKGNGTCKPGSCKQSACTANTNASANANS